MKDKDFDKLWNSGATAREYRQCPISDHELETIIGNAIERDSKTRKKHFPVWQKPYVYLAMVAACMAAVVVGLWQVGGNLMFVAPASDALQSSTSLLAAQTTDMPVTDTPILHHHDDKPATITDNEIKNTIVQSADRHDEPILTAEQNIITDVPTQKNETANLLQKHNAIAENIDTPKPKIYCSNGCSDEYIMGLFDECVLA